MTRVERLAYHKEYNRRYRKLKPGMTSIVAIKRDKLMEQLEQLENATKVLGMEPENIFFKTDLSQICSEFGCGKTLSRQEKLYGNYCINHQNKSKYGGSA